MAVSTQNSASISAASLATHLAIGDDTLLTAIGSAVYTTDHRGVITYYNQAARDLWATAPVIGESLWCGSFEIYTVDGEHLPHDKCPMAICLKTGQGIDEAEIVVARPDGARRNVIVSPQPLRDGDGNLIGAINTLTDVTELRRTQSQYHSSSEIVGSLLANSQDCIKILDLDGRITTINPSGCKSMEISSPDEARGLNYFDLWTGSARSALLAAAKIARDGGDGRFQGAFTNRLGVTTTWDVRIAMTEDAAGRPTGYIVVSRDVSRELQSADFKERQIRLQATLSEIAREALNPCCFDEFLDETAQLVSAALDVPLVKILRYCDSAEELLLVAGVGWRDGTVGVDRIPAFDNSQAGYTMRQKGPVIVVDLKDETRFTGSQLMLDHHVRSGVSMMISGDRERPFGVIGVHIPELRVFDASEVSFLDSVAQLIASSHRHQRARDRQTLLVREIAHRAGNMLQFVSSIFNQTVRGATTLEDVKSRFGVRLSQMSRANMLLSEDGWTKTNILTLVETTLEPFQNCLKTDGLDIMLPADLCFDLSLVLHELATNSSKYGAFTGGESKVLLEWKLSPACKDKRCLTLNWHDTKPGDFVASSGTGFGTKLIQQLIENKWNGSVTTDLEPHFICRIEFPLPEGDALLA